MKTLFDVKRQMSNVKREIKPLPEEPLKQNECHSESRPACCRLVYRDVQRTPSEKNLTKRKQGIFNVGNFCATKFVTLNEVKCLKLFSRLRFFIPHLPASRARCSIQNDNVENRFTFALTLLIVVLTFSVPACIDAQVFSPNDIEISKSTFKFAAEKNLSSKPIGDVVVEVGKSFLGTGYVAHTLEIDGEEQLVINLTGFDCTTFLETALAFARCIKKGDTTFAAFQKELTLIRYRNGKINHYPSRLHYFTDWIYDNERKGIVKDVTKEIGGKKIKFNLNFMSSHPQYYKHLKEQPEFIPVIKKQEEEINERTYYYIPKKELREHESKIKNGDLLAFTTTVKGLDVNHVGIAVKTDDGRIHLLHAPIEGSPVQITSLPLTEYVMKLKKDMGVIVARPLEP